MYVIGLIVEKLVKAVKNVLYFTILYQYTFLEK